MPMRCEIATQDKLLYEGPADVVVAPGIEGEMGILPKHAPLLTALDIGVLSVRHKGEEHVFTIAGGVMEVRPDLVTVLADTGEDVNEIDEQRAKAARERAEEILKKGPPPDTDEYLAIEAALRRSKLRLDAVMRYRRERVRPSPGTSEREEA
jgi:F-type H+-transporting ATPase subunit epsilon